MKVLNHLPYATPVCFQLVLLVSFFRWTFSASVPIRRGTGTTTGRRTCIATRSRRRASTTQTSSTTSHRRSLRKAKSECIKASSLRPAGTSGYRYTRNDRENALHSAHSLFTQSGLQVKQEVIWAHEREGFYSAVSLRVASWLSGSDEIRAHNLLGTSKYSAELTLSLISW